MSSPAALPVLQQLTACFAVDAMLQVPLLALAAWCAVALGRPQPCIAYRIWCGTLLLSLLVPAGSTWAVNSASRVERAQVTSEAGPDPRALPPFEPKSPWMRFLHGHRSNPAGVQPLMILSGQYARGITRVYAAVTLLCALRFILLWLRLRRLVKIASRQAVPAAILEALHGCCAMLRLPVPRCRISSSIPGPALAGVVRPVLLLPVTAAALSHDDIQAVLAHELAHLRRRDPLFNVVFAWLLVPVSFHPVAWWISRRIRHTREMACDVEAARTVGSVHEYATAVLRVAESMMLPSGLRWSAHGLDTELLGMFNAKGTMEERMQALVAQRTGTRRSRVARAAACVTIASTGIFAAGLLRVQPAMAHEQQLVHQSHASQPESPTASVDSQHNPTPTETITPGSAGTVGAPTSAPVHQGAAMPLIHGVPVTIDPAQMPDGTALQAEAEKLQESMADLQQQMNSAAWKEQLDAQHKAMEQMHALMDSPEWKAQMKKQQDLAASLSAQVNSPAWRAEMEQQQKLAARMHDLVNAPAWKEQIEKQREMEARIQAQVQSPEFQARMDAARKLANDQVARLSTPNPVFTAPVEGEPLKISAGVLAANSTHKENPVYPPDAKQKGTQGAVVLHVLVSEVGTVDQISAISSPDDALTRSAIDAVRQWTYKPFLLNGTAVPVESTVTVTYSLAK